jgi:hypothetical protein
MIFSVCVCVCTVMDYDLVCLFVRFVILVDYHIIDWCHGGL